MTLEDIAAHLEIKQVLYRYCRGVDRGERQTISSVYHPGAIDRHGPWQGEGRTFGDYLVPSMDRTPLIGQHHITNVIIELSNDSAAVESYFVAFHPETVDDGSARHVLVAGRYLDHFERRDGVWAIAERTVVVDVSGPLSLETWAGASHFPAGGRREQDPSAHR